MNLTAHAKINLTLEVLRKRDDGYHEIVSLMYRLGIHDLVSISTASEIIVETNLPSINGRENLAYRAALLMRDEFDVNAGAKIQINKRIPLAAGLGGGSADAATVINGLNSLWSINADEKTLVNLGSSIGSDIPFMLQDNSAIVKSRGEIVEQIPSDEQLSLVLLFPEIVLRDKTKTMYSYLTKNHYSDGRHTLKAQKYLENGNKLPIDATFNVFDQVVGLAYPELQKYKDAFLEVGATNIGMAGSGPSLFSLVETESEGLIMVTNLQKKGFSAAFTTTVK